MGNKFAMKSFFRKLGWLARRRDKEAELRAERCGMLPRVGPFAKLQHVADKVEEKELVRTEANHQLDDGVRAQP